jgi:hypothetical protein
MTSTTPASSSGNSYAAGWYLVKLADGTIGLIRHASEGAITTSGDTSPLAGATLLTSDISTGAQYIIDGQVGNVMAAFTSLGATQAQTSAFIEQSSENGHLYGSSLAQLLIGKTGTAASTEAFNKSGKPISIAPTGSAVPDNIIPSPSISSSWEQGVENVLAFVGSERGWIRILEYVGGAALIFIAIKGAADG